MSSHKETAMEIGEAIREDGRALSGIARWAKCFTYWADCVDGIGLDEAVAAAERGWIAKDESIDIYNYVSPVLMGDAADVIAMLPGSQRARAVRLGVSEGTVSGWLSGDHDMSRSVRHLVLALLGYQISDGGRWSRVR